MLVALKILFLFLAVWMTIVNVIKVNYRDNIQGGNFLLMAIGIVGFVVLQFELYLN
jgi:hypothetical protein